jgi:hypothetical protein
MTDTTSGRPMTEGEISSHGESHTSMSGRKSRGMSRVDPTETFPQVTKSRAQEEKSRTPLPREVTFSALSLGRAERDPERGIDQQNPPREADPEPVAPIAERVLDDLAARRREALNRLRRAHGRTTPPAPAAVADDQPTNRSEGS